MRTDLMTSAHRFTTFDTIEEATDAITKKFGTPHFTDGKVFKWYAWREHYSEPFEVSLWLEIGSIFRDRVVVWKILGSSDRFTTVDFEADPTPK